MKLEFSTKEFVVLAVIFALIGAIVGWGLSYQPYYHRGASNTMLYYDTTGQFPSRTWLDEFENNTLRYPQEVIESLHPYDSK